MELKMADEVSNEAIMLAEAFGLALAGLSRALQVKGLLHQGDVNSALFASVRRIRQDAGLAGTPEQREQIAAAIQRKATI